MTIKQYILIGLCCIPAASAWSQDSGIWTAFWNEDTTLTGYKDSAGHVKIEPKFTAMTIAAKFENIIAASEQHNGHWTSYYLTRSGRAAARDSLYIIDNSPDCENEGFIRFRDPKTGQAGMLNREGKITIPPVYNDLTNVRNGMVIALIDAKKEYGEYGEYGDHDAHEGCNHFTWTGGRSILIDTLNNTLIKNIQQGHSLDMYSLEKVSAPHTDTVRASFQGVDGYYYSFVDFDKEFRQWIINELQTGLTPERLISLCHDTLILDSPEGWVKSNREDLISEHFIILRTGLSENLHQTANHFITRGGLNPFLYEGPDFDKYFNHCHESKDWIYPVMTIVISHHQEDNALIQDHYEFLRTDSGYKLIGLSIRSLHVE